MWDNRDGYDGGRYAGRQQKRCGTATEEIWDDRDGKWVERTVTDWANINRGRLIT